jgi:hypothetical protein
MCAQKSYGHQVAESKCQILSSDHIKEDSHMLWRTEQADTEDPC